VQQKEQSVENRFLKIYNRQGHYSVTQSIQTVWGKTMCSIARVMQCIFCCQCLGCCGIKPQVDFKRFLINLTKLLALIMITLTLGFATLTINE